MKTMILQGFVLNADVFTSGFYDQVTGALKPGISVTLTVVEDEADSKEVYQCSLSDGFPSLDMVKQELKQNGGHVPQDVLDQRVQQLRAELPPKMTPIVLRVRRVKAKQGFMTLVCRLAQVPATV
jgi:hypothetical protein